MLSKQRGKMRNKKTSVLSNLFGNSKTQKNRNIQNQIEKDFGFKTYFHDLPQPAWMNRNYTKFADEAYTKNVIAYTILPLLDDICDALNRWLVPMFKGAENLFIGFDEENISALASRS
jgi:hypothetical protein